MYSVIRKFNSDVHLYQFKIDKDTELILVDAGQNVKVPLSKLENQWMINQGFKSVAKINMGFFNTDVIGWNMVDWGYVLSEGWKDGIYEAFFMDGKLMLDDVDKAGFDSKYKGKAHWGTSLSYTLVINGTINIKGAEKFSHATSRNPRTMVGQKSDGTLVLAVVDGRTSSSVGMTAKEQAQTMLDLGCVVAINADGGGSSEMIVNGVIKNRPSDGAERSIANGLVVYSKEKQVENNGGTGMKKIVLDAGHGYNTPGKRTPDGVREWYLNANVCNYVAEKLKLYQDVEVYRTDDTTGNTDITLNARTTKVKEIKPDMFISVHHNANTSNWGSWTGVEAYAHPSANQIDKDLARKFSAKLSAHTGLKDRGGKTADFQVLRDTLPLSCPNILIEGGFMDSTIDNPVITTWGQEAYADAIVEVLVEYLKLQLKPVEPPKPEPTPDPEPVTWYRVVCGSYSDRANAESIKSQLESQGYKGVWIDTFKK